MATFQRNCEKCGVHFADGFSASEHICPVESLSSDTKLLAFLGRFREERENGNDRKEKK